MFDLRRESKLLRPQHFDRLTEMDARVTELHCIMPIDNVVSVMAHGILSYERAAKLKHR